jgi:hypothetical protein
MIAHGKENATMGTASDSRELDETTPNSSEKQTQATSCATRSSYKTKEDDGTDTNGDAKTAANASNPRQVTTATTTTTVVAQTEEKTGRWTQEENLQFLIGLKVVGAGKWNKLEKYCPNRCVLF